MAKHRTEFERVVREGWFAWVYWCTLALGICTIAAIWIWAPALLAVSGPIAFSLVVGLLLGRYALAARLRRTRSDGAEAEHTHS